MEISVEHVYRVKIGGKVHMLGADDAMRLAHGIVGALGIAPQSEAGAAHAPDHLGEAAVVAPRELGSGSVAEPIAKRPSNFQTDRPPWQQADTDRLRELAAGGMTGPEIAAVMDRPVGTIRTKATKYQIKIGRAGAPAEVEAEEPAAQSPAVEDDLPAPVEYPEERLIAPVPSHTPELPEAVEHSEPATAAPEATAEAGEDHDASPTPNAPPPDTRPFSPVRVTSIDPLAEQVLTGPLRPWDIADTKRLIWHMGFANTKAEIETAAEAAADELNRTPMSCKNRWGHLKNAGKMTVRDFMRDPESVPVEAAR